MSGGDRYITAVYEGDGNFSGSTSSVLTQTVDQASTTTTVSSSSSTSVSGQAVTFTATVSNSVSGTPTGAVTFLDGSTVLATTAVDSSSEATFTTSDLSVASHDITAEYSGDGNFTGSTSSTLTQTVNASGGHTWMVVNTNDAGTGSGYSGDLAYCLSNAASGDSVVFDIESGGVRVSDPTITLTSALPAINCAITIDGYSQAGYDDPANGPQVQIDGSGLTGDPVAAGLYVTAGGVTIQGLAIYNVSSNGVELNNPSGSAGDLVQGCYIGTGIDGDSGVGNGTGVLIEGPNDTVGDPTGVAPTVISGNTNDGVDASGAHTLVTYAWIGVDLTGLAALANGGNGVVLNGDSDSANSVISGNTGDGIKVNGTNNDIYADKIGVGKDGHTQVANTQYGVDLISASYNNVGLATQDKNIISGNTGDGVVINGGGDNTVANNWIGIGTGPVAVGNDDGVTLTGNTSYNTIGGLTAAARNVISGNSVYGVYIWEGATYNVVEGNYVGTDDAGTGAMGNGSAGVEVNGDHNTIGGSAAGATNVISANGYSNNISGYGVQLTGLSNLVTRNWLGRTKDGTDTGNAIHNNVGGIDGATNNTVEGNGGQP